MIAESPMASCGRGATPERRGQVERARVAVRLCTRAEISGVAFFDALHGQTGVAPNGIELHPILAFTCLSSSGSPTPARAPPGSSKVRLVSVTSPVRHGADATLIAATAIPATCSITVHYKSGASVAAGLYAKRSTGGRVSWTWKVGTRTTPGRWPIDVSCGPAGSLHTSFAVL
jgi:hypothetical protein